MNRTCTNKLLKSKFVTFFRCHDNLFFIENITKSLEFKPAYKMKMLKSFNKMLITCLEFKKWYTFVPLNLFSSTEQGIHSVRLYRFKNNTPPMPLFRCTLGGFFLLGL